MRVSVRERGEALPPLPPVAVPPVVSPDARPPVVSPPVAALPLPHKAIAPPPGGEPELSFLLPLPTA